MYWWIYIIIGFVIGALIEAISNRFLKRPFKVGDLIIADDPDNPTSYYIFLRAWEDPEEIRKRQEVWLRVIDKTRK